MYKKAVGQDINAPTVHAQDLQIVPEDEVAQYRKLNNENLDDTKGLGWKKVLE